MVFLRMAIATLIPAIMAILFYFFDTKTKFSKLSTLKKQIVAGVVFGVLACLATQFGVPYEDYIMNVRSASPLIAGLVFGGPAGLIAGIIGTIYRVLYSVWMHKVGTVVACSVATLLAGIIGTLCRKYMFREKRISWFYGMFVAMATEVFHMLLVFLTFMDDINYAFSVVKVTAIPMISANGIAVLLALLLVSLLSKEELYQKKERRPLTQTFSVYLFVSVLFAFLITTTFTYFLQNNVSQTEVENLLSKNIEDVENDIKDADNRNQLTQMAKYRHIGKEGFVFILSSDYQVVSAPEGEVTQQNVTLFSQGLSEKPDNEVLTFTTAENVEYYYMKDTVEGYIVFGCIPREEATFSRDISVYIGEFMQFIVFTILFVMVFYLIRRTIIDNIQKVNDSLHYITKGDLSKKIEVRESEEFNTLSADINKTVDRLKEYISDAEQRIDRELSFAKSIQHSALPTVFPPYPERTDFDIYAQMNTAKEVGGDFYDFYLLSDNRLAFLIADVSGKGIPSAMFMMRAKTLIKSLAESGLDVAQIFTIANEKLCEHNDAGMFVTAWMGILDLSNGVLKYANAGHNPPVLKQNGNAYEFIKSRPGLVLAGMEGMQYRGNEMTLRTGDEIFLYTDGVTEATNERTELFGNENLRTVLQNCKGKTARDICKTVKTEIDNFVGEAPQFDDITMLSLRMTEQNGKELTLNATVENIETVTNFVDELLEKNGCTPKAMIQINVAIDEIFGNIAHYAYPENTVGKASVFVAVEPSTHQARITFVDEGKMFNPLEKKDPNVTLSAEERQIGGLGIFMVKKTMDEMEYQYQDGKNKLTIVKTIG